MRLCFHLQLSVSVSIYSSCFTKVQSWDAVTSGSVFNLDMGRAIAGVVIHPSTRGASLQVGANNMEKLATSGSL
ncbi:hypothetical protein EMCRGX_G020902 [Ephydatia muelleri]